MTDEKNPIVTGGKKPLIKLPLFITRRTRQVTLVLLALFIVIAGYGAFHIYNKTKDTKSKSTEACRKAQNSECGKKAAEQADPEKAFPGAELMRQAAIAEAQGNKAEAIRLYKEAAEILIRTPTEEANALHNTVNTKIKALGGTDRHGLR